MRRRNPKREKEQWAVTPVKRLRIAYTHCTNGVAVVGLIDAHEQHAFGLAGQLAVLERHLERDLDSGRTGVGIKHPLQPARCNVDEALGKFYGRHIAQSQHGRVSNSIELRADRFDDLSSAVPVYIAPKRRDAVEVAPPLGIE